MIVKDEKTNLRLNNYDFVNRNEDRRHKFKLETDSFYIGIVQNTCERNKEQTRLVNSDELREKRMHQYREGSEVGNYINERMGVMT